MSLADELAKLQQLREMGTLNEDEFAAAKSKLLANSESNHLQSGNVTLSADELERQTRQWAFLLHISHFAGYCIPIAGFIAPVIIWQLKKDKLPLLDVHGKNVVNWIISKCLYFVLCVLLVFILIGIPMLLALVICDIVFTIIAAIKANEGQVWKYPGTIDFVK